MLVARLSSAVILSHLSSSELALNCGLIEPAGGPVLAGSYVLGFN
jgi:hypothetical protein